jgi:pyrroline-5-carboxylate reductase
VTVALLGAGKMGEALLAGLLAAGTPAADVRIVERDEARAAALAYTYGVTPADLATAATADVVLVVVKPQDVADVLTELGPSLRPGTVVASLAAGLSTAALESHLPPGVPVVRVMPNTPLLVREGMSVICGGTAADASHLTRVEALLATAGRVVRLPEYQFDAVTAVSGSGPAYLFLLAEAMIDAGVLLGLPRPVATELVAQTAVGAATMLRDSGEHPAVLREAVTSPGGTTAAALRAFEEGGLRATVANALEAAARRSAELAGN